jgi:hypothetical protein
MNKDSCKVSNGGAVLWSGAEGSRNLPRDLTEKAGDIRITFTCASEEGAEKETSVLITVE